MSPPLRVLMTADTVGGVWTYALELARALATYGVEVALATMGAPVQPHQRDEAAALPNLILYESAYKLEWMEEPWEDVEAAGQWLLELEAAVRPDVIHLNGFCHGGLPWRAPVVMAGHSCVLSWWRAVRGSEPPSHWQRYRREVARGLRSAGLVIAPSRAMLNALDDHYGPLPSRRVVYNGVAAERFWPGPKRDVVLSAGRLWDEGKNIAALNAITPRLSWPVYAAGETRTVEPGADHPAGVRWLGQLCPEQLIEWMASASIYALPARYEPFGLSALEAALCGCALVLGDIPSLREVWGDAALYVSPNDHDALHVAIEGLIADAEKRIEHAGRARERARRYTADAMAARTLECYRSLLRADGPLEIGKGRRYRADRAVHSLADLGLEPRERALPARRGDGADRPRA